MSQLLHSASQSASSSATAQEWIAEKRDQLRAPDPEDTVRRMATTGSVLRAARYLKEYDGDVDLQRGALEVAARFAEGCKEYGVFFPCFGFHVADLTRHVAGSDAETRKHAVTVVHTLVVVNGSRLAKSQLKEVLGDASSGVAAALTTIADGAGTFSDSAVEAVELLIYAGHWAGDSDAVAQIIPQLTRALQTPDHVSKALRLLHAVVANHDVGTAEFNATIGELVNHGAISAIVAVLSEGPDDRTVAAPAWRILLKVCSSPDAAHERHIQAVSGLLEALPALAAGDRRYAFVASALSVFFKSNPGEMLRHALLDAVSTSMAMPENCTEETNYAMTVHPDAIARIVAAGFAPFVTTHLGQPGDVHAGVHRHMLHVLFTIVHASDCEGERPPEPLMNEELVDNVARHLHDADPDAVYHAVRVLELMVYAYCDDSARVGESFGRSLGGLVPDLIELAKRDDKPLAARVTAAGLVAAMYPKNADYDSSVRPLMPVVDDALSRPDQEDPLVVPALKARFSFASATGDGDSIRQSVAALVQAASSSTAPRGLVARVCGWMVDAVTFDPAATPHIVAAGAIVVPLAAKHLGAAYDAHPRVQRDVLTSVAELAGYEQHNAPSPFMNAELVGNIARHIERNADDDAVHAAVEALRAIKAIDEDSFAVALGNSSIAIDADLAPALVDHAKRSATPLDAALAAVDMIHFTLPWNRDDAAVASIIPLLTRALTLDDYVHPALSLLRDFVDRGAATLEAAVDELIDCGTIRQVVLTASQGDADVAASAGELLFMVCESEDEAHKCHVADSGLLEAIPALLASSDEEYAAMALAGVLNGDMDMLSHVLHVSSGAVATLAQRLTNSDAGTPVALVRCLNTMAVAAGPDERLWLIELGMPQAFVSACTARHVRPPPLPSASVYQYFAGFEDDGEATDMHA